MNVRALTFDVFGTLLDWHSGIARAFQAGDVDGDPGELATDWRDRFWPVTREVNHGERPWGDFDELHAATLAALEADRGLVLSAHDRSRLLGAWRRLDPWPDVRGGLEELRRGRAVATISNGHIALLVDLVRHADLRFDALFSAELQRLYKPKSDVYLTAVRLLGLEPGEVMMVAAHPMDLEAARRAGLRSAYIDRPLEYGPGSPARTDPDADFSVSDLAELAVRLETASGRASLFASPG